MALRKIQLIVGSEPKGQAVTFPYPFRDGKRYLIPTYKFTVFGTDDKGYPNFRDFEVIRFGVNRPEPTSSPRIVGLADQQIHTIKAWLPYYRVHSAQTLEIGAWQVYDDYLIHDGPDLPMSQLYATAGCIEICGGAMFTKFNDLVISLSGSIENTRDKKLAIIGSSGIMVITYMKAERPPLKIKN